MEELKSKAAKDRHVFLDVFKTNRFSLLSTMVEPDPTKSLLGELRAVARVRLARAALAVERCRSAHAGQVPASLAELVPTYLAAIPADPFDGQRLRYKKLPTGYVIYSIGEDFTDNGGTEQPAGQSWTAGDDLTFTVER
jgi:hypothetical protein